MTALDDKALDLIFREARTRNGWADIPVSDDQIKAIYDLFKWGPTAVNSTPARVVWVTSPEAKARLEPLLSEGNRAKTMAAPVVAIVGYDLDFPETLTKLFPHAPGIKDAFPDPAVREKTAFRNATLQGGYLIVAARALGLDTGPMSGFDHEGVEREFFAGRNIKAVMVVSIGHGTDEKLRPRGPRLDFDEANTIV
jgi:3-hydroxypropanoate dehydrogenase